MFQGYIIFHRHGHRAPSKNIISDINNQAKSCMNESFMWQSFMMSNDFLDTLSTRFPIKVYPLNSPAIDFTNHPFGCLTKIGFDHLTFIGNKVVQKFPVIQDTSFVEVVSTNYMRTQVSAQALLHGMNFSQNVEITVKHVGQCSMSFYDGNKKLADRLIRSIQSRKEFKELENEIIPVKQALLDMFPLLKKDENNIDWLAG